MEDNRTFEDLVEEIHAGFREFCQKWGMKEDDPATINYDVMDQHDAWYWGLILPEDQRQWPEINKDAETFFPTLVERINHLEVNMGEDNIGVVTLSLVGDVRPFV